MPRLPRKSHRRPRDARAYIRPLAEHQMPRLPRKSHRQSNGDQGTPGRTSDPLQTTKCCACHAKATGRGWQARHLVLCKGSDVRPGVPWSPVAFAWQAWHLMLCKGSDVRPGVPWSLPLCRCLLPTETKASDPLQSTKCCACHARATGRAAETKGRQGRTVGVMHAELQSRLSIYLSIDLSISLSLSIYLSDTL